MSARNDKRIGTQRALMVTHRETAPSDFPTLHRGFAYALPTDIPVLVIPEADVKGCNRTHVRKMSPVDRWCENCGAFKGAFTTRWIKPRILRVGRGKK